jgi:hypothetical protein
LLLALLVAAGLHLGVAVDVDAGLNEIQRGCADVLHQNVTHRVLPYQQLRNEPAIMSNERGQA